MRGSECAHRAAEEIQQCLICESEFPAEAGSTGRLTRVFAVHGYLDVVRNGCTGIEGTFVTVMGGDH